MRLILPLGAALLILPVMAAAAGPCGPGKHRRCVPEDTTVDLTSVPDISKRIVATEPAPPPVTHAVDGGAAVYNGPTLGLAPIPKRAPTINYKWSIE